MAPSTQMKANSFVFTSMEGAEGGRVARTLILKHSSKFLLCSEPWVGIGKEVLFLKEAL